MHTTAVAGAIAVHGVSKWFSASDGSALQVLDNISLEVPAHSVVAILGASGCGKSTLLNIISGLVTPERGEIHINGVPAREFDDWRSVSYMFQEDRLLPWRTALRNVEFALEAGGMLRSERESRAREALKLVGLEAFADAFPYQLSGGMRSRVALARSLVLEPCILLMDEPFSRLDALTRAQMHEELLRIQQLKNMTIVFVTHDVEEAVVLADGVVVLAPRPGRVRELVAINLPRPRDTTQNATAQQAHHLKSLI
ncbi:MAG: ABC transporter ATP-binding protein [Betaproteobacteria bacterium]|jgi:ABC-type nitrate/sulfonate/bicarbonate transport system ATPase subunit|nr:ABC transporter ATP-binding protein [Betaproteobacteria bacterium]